MLFHTKRYKNKERERGGDIKRAGKRESGGINKQNWSLDLAILFKCKQHRDQHKQVKLEIRWAKQEQRLLAK